MFKLFCRCPNVEDLVARSRRTVGCDIQPPVEEGLNPYPNPFHMHRNTLFVRTNHNMMFGSVVYYY